MFVEVKIIRITNLYYSFSESTKKGKRLIAESLTFDNPSKHAFRKTIKKFNAKNFTFKRGMLNTVQTFLKVRKIKFELIDYDYDLPVFKIDERLTNKYIHQKQAVENFYQKRFGIIKVPTRGGKTFIASEIIRIFLDNYSGNFLFVVDNVTLFNQAVSDINLYFEQYGGIKIGKIKSDTIELNRVNVAMIQTLQSIFSKKNKNLKKRSVISNFFKSLTFLCVDEVHDNMSSSKMFIFNKIEKNLEFLLCLSATPFKSNSFEQNLKLQEWSGGIIYDIEEKTLRERNVLSDYKVFMIYIDHTSSEYIEEGYDIIQKKLMFYNSFRNKVLLNVFNVLVEMGIKSLFVFLSVKHGILISRKTNSVFLSHLNTGEVRSRELKNFLAKKDGVLMSSNIFKKGITLPECQAMVNVNGGLQEANTIQKKGRVLGVTENKNKSMVIDFIDHDDSYLSRHSLQRIETYAKDVGDKNIIIINTNEDDWSLILKKEIRKWLK